SEGCIAVAAQLDCSAAVKLRAAPILRKIVRVRRKSPPSVAAVGIAVRLAPNVITEEIHSIVELHSDLVLDLYLLPKPVGFVHVDDAATVERGIGINGRGRIPRIVGSRKRGIEIHIAEDMHAARID